MTAERQPVSQDEKIYGAISYVSFLSVLMLLTKKDSPFIRFHARQGVILFIGSLFWVIPVIGVFVAVVCYVGMVIGFIKAYNGEQFKIPFISQLAERIKF